MNPSVLAQCRNFVDCTTTDWEIMPRQRAPTNPLEAANQKSDEDFVRDYLLSRYGALDSALSKPGWCGQSVPSSLGTNTAGQPGMDQRVDKP